MKMLSTFIAVLLAVGGGMILGSVVRAQDKPVAASPADGQHGMMNGGVNAMMGMMGQMSHMMENCNRMMQSRNDRNEEKGPAKNKKEGQ